MTQEIIVYVILSLAASYVIFNTVKSMRTKKASGCDGCSGCAVKDIKKI